MTTRESTRGSLKWAKSATSALAVLVVVIAGGFSALAGPEDTPLPGTASIANEAHDLPSGTTRMVRIAFTAMGAQPVSWVRFSPGDNIKVIGGAATADMNSGGWVMSSSNNRILFRGGQALAGKPESFDINVEVKSVSGVLADVDRAVTWNVESSFDNGAHKRVNGPPADQPNELTSVVRVLQIIEGPVISAPAGAADGTMTTGQTIALHARVKNVGTKALTIRGTWTGSNLTVGATPSASLAPGQEGNLDTTATVGAAGTPASFDFRAATATGDAVADPHGSANSTVQTAVAITCEDITPADVNPNAAQTFSANFEKTGQPAVTGIAASIRVNSNIPFQTPPKLVDMLAGNLTTLDKTHADPIIMNAVTPTGNDGVHDAKLLFVGSDANGAPLNFTLDCGNDVRIDRALPVLTVDFPELPLLALAGNTDTMQGAAKNGDTIKYTGKMTDNPTCTGGSFKKGEIREFNGASQQIAVTPFDPAAAFLPAGADCSYIGELESLQFNANSRSFRIYLEAADSAGNRASNVSPAVPVDNIPAVFTAKTISTDTVRVDFNECVSGSSLMLDWRAGSHLVLSVTPVPCSTGGPMLYQAVTLGLLPIDKMASTDELPVVSYAKILPAILQATLRTLGQDTTYIDWAGNNLSDPFAIAAIDGAAPDLAVMDSVTPGQMFYTNGGGDKRPTFTYSNLLAGHRVCLSVDGNSNGKVDAGDTLLTNTCPAVAAGASKIAIKVDTALSGADRVIPILARVIDATGNESTASRSITFDTIGPRIIGANMSVPATSVRQLGIGGDAVIRVSLDDDLVSGSDHGDDWSLFDNNGLELFDVTVARVTPCAGAEKRCRMLEIDAGGTNRWQSIKRLRYTPTAGTAYTDLAGNTASTSAVAVSTGGGSTAGSQSQRSSSAPAATTPSLTVPTVGSRQLLD